MLQIKNIKKEYKSGDLVQEALNGVTLSFRDSEFAAVLGPSGSGKTTLLNIIGGLDRYDSGEMFINNVSTKKYKDRDWDSYRNHSIGFVFQNYNLIAHQSILSNVELALTISGVSKRERRKKAKTVLTQVGLGDQMHKKPNQLSGGQMQRVAIARALVNDPDILLADEPTGALDSETSVQVLDLLKKVASEKLVIMVTHNAELANRYANRIIKLRDGVVISDSNAYEQPSILIKAVDGKDYTKTSMSFFTSLSLSLNNLLTKKWRTVMTAFAGSIGIIGISLILALSNGVNTYIIDIQKDTMSSYPVTIDQQTIDLNSMLGSQNRVARANTDVTHNLDAIYANHSILEMANEFTTSLMENNLTEFKIYLDDPDSEIHQYIRSNGIQYSYSVPFSVYTRNSDGSLIDANENVFTSSNMGGSSLGAASTVQQNLMGSVTSVFGSFGGSSSFSSEIFEQMPAGTQGTGVGSETTDSYDLLFGTWPASYNEAVLILDENNEVPTTALYALGMIPASDYANITESMQNTTAFELKDYRYSYDEILDKIFYVLSPSDFYTRSEDGTFRYEGSDQSALERLTNVAIPLHIVGIIRPAADANNATLTGVIGYTSAMTDYLIQHANTSAIVVAQHESTDINVLTGLHFAPGDDATKVADAKAFINSLGVSDKAQLATSLLAGISASAPALSMLPMDEVTLANMIDQQLANAPDSTFLTIYDNYIAQGSYQDNMQAFGFVSLDAPTSISLYADTFEAKDGITASIAAYNEQASENNQITYTDLVALITSSITTIIDAISYVLIAFVAISLIVSSIMIGIITYISVLERTKEIGILRAIGASKKDVSRVFTAETFIIGFAAGLLGILFAYLLQIPINAIIHQLLDNASVNAVLPLGSGVILIALSILLTLIGGIIPSRKAARKDPVLALRSE